MCNIVFREVDDLKVDEVFGLILNVPSDYKLLGFVPMPFNSKHWIAIRSLPEGNYYNLDSKLEKPVEIGKVCTLNMVYK